MRYIAKEGKAMIDLTKKTGYPSVDKTHLQGIPEEILHPEIPVATIFATFMHVNEKNLDEMAIFDGGIGHTKKELRDDVLQTASALLEIGITPGSTIVLGWPNSYEGIVTIIGANAIGVKVVMSEVSKKAVEHEVILHAPQAVFIYDTNPADMDVSWAKQLSSTHKQLKAVFMMSGVNKRFMVISDLYARSPREIWSHFVGGNSLITHYTGEMTYTLRIVEEYGLSKGEEPMLYLKTSGSTSGKPKTLPFSNKAIVAALIFAANSTGMQTRDRKIGRVLCNAPYQHGYGWMPLFVHLMGGNEVVLSGAKPEDVAGWHRMELGQIYGTPLSLKQFMESTPEGTDLSSLTAFYVAGAAIPEEEFQEGIRYFRAHNSQAEIRNNYGISEALCVGTASDGVPHREGTIGKFYVGPEWVLVDEKLNEVKYGETGEALVASPTLCDGYFNDFSAEEKAFITYRDKTFFRTGDFLSLAEDGYVTFVGRKRRFFFAEGVTDKVNCETIEQALEALPEVKQAAVIVAKGEKNVEYAKAFVEATDVTKEEILTKLSESLQDFQLPKELIFIDKIPVMASGKIDYKKLEDL